ncbi:MAG: respiratory nitrate reductase subunit gamma [Thermoproteus sp.]
MTPLALALWVSMPYIVLTVFVGGHIYRYSVDQYGWTSKSSELLESRWLGVGSQLFHWGFLIVILGHVVGLLVSRSVDLALGVSDEAYHAVAMVLGGAAGTAAYIGAWILLLRRLVVGRVRAATDPSDLLVLVLIIITATLGLYNTIVYNLIHGPFEYRTTIGAWVRSVLTLQPNPSLMDKVPLTFQLHIFFAYLVFLVWPFTRLVHVWSYPIFYLRRGWILYRRARRYLMGL